MCWIRDPEKTYSRADPGFRGQNSARSRIRIYKLGKWLCKITFPNNAPMMLVILCEGESLSLAWRHTVKAHVQAITCLAVQGSRFITGKYF
jgi:hypothetical protein